MSKYLWCRGSLLHLSPSGIGILAVVVVFAVSACTTLDPKDQDGKIIKTHYTLRAGDRKLNPPPLPAKTPISVDWHYSDGSSSTISGFRGYDFDGDGRFEMVEVLKKDGTIQSYVYDFDHDGRVDQVTPHDARTGATPLVEDAQLPDVYREFTGPMPTPPLAVTPDELSPALTQEVIEPVQIESHLKSELTGKASANPLVPARDSPRGQSNGASPVPELAPEELEPVAPSGSTPAL